MVGKGVVHYSPDLLKDRGFTIYGKPAGGFDLDSQFGRFVNPGHALEGLSFIMRRLMATPASGRDGKILDFALRETRIMGEFGASTKVYGVTRGSCKTW